MSLHFGKKILQFGNFKLQVGNFRRLLDRVLTVCLVLRPAPVPIPVRRHRRQG